MRSMYRTFPLLMALVLPQCAEVQDLVSVTPSELLRLAVSRAAIPADGATTVTITAELSNAAGADQRTIFFRTDAGSLLDGTGGTDQMSVVADLSGHASVQLEAPTTLGRATVVATISLRDADGEIVPGDLGRSVAIEFTWAYPDRIELSVTPAAIASGNSTAQVTASLFRNLGVPTDGTVVEFSAIANGGSIGSFSDITASAINGSFGEATATFTPGVTSFQGTATITARVVNAQNGQVLAATAPIEIGFVTPSNGPLVSNLAPLDGSCRGGESFEVEGSGFASAPPSVEFGLGNSARISGYNDVSVRGTVPSAGSSCPSYTCFGTCPPDKYGCDVDIIVRSAGGRDTFVAGYTYESSSATSCVR